jgi:hypothetical protein
MSNEVLAASLYTNPALSFGLAVLGIVIAIVAGIFGDFIKISPIQRRIRCKLVSTERALSSTSLMPIRYGDKEPENPYTAAIEIANIGRGISQDLFSENEGGDRRGIEWDVGVPIEGILSLSHDLENSPEPRLSKEERKLILKPGLIAKGETIHVTLLTEGPVHKIRLTQDPFANVKIETRNYEEDRQRRRAVAFRLAWGSLCVGIVAIVIVGVNSFIGHAENSVDKTLNTTFNDVGGRAACILTEPSFRDAMLSLELALRDINIERDAQGKPMALHLAATYTADVKEATLDVTIFVYDYEVSEAFGAASRLATPSGIPSAVQEAISRLKRLPNEGISKADLDVQMISHTVSRLPALSTLSLWCKGDYTNSGQLRFLTSSGAPSGKS